MARNNNNNKPGPKTANITVLPTEHDVTIPPMPPAEEWINRESVAEMLGAEAKEPAWHPAVVRWWEDIWSSPMAAEFVNSDIHGLYLGCYYLHESLEAGNKLSDRISAGKMFENTVKNFGLNPSARNSLKWQVAQGTAAEKRTSQIRESETRKKVTSIDKAQSQAQDLYRRNG